jgi:hypothetical protein
MSRHWKVVNMDEMTKERLKLLDELYKKNGALELFYMDKTGRCLKTWNRWKEYSQCTDSEKAQANLRSILKSEVVLDLEDLGELAETLRKLNRDGHSYETWRSGSIGCHIHLVFSKLDEIPDEDVERIKELMIKRYGGDISKKSSRNLVALELAPHFKTGRCKTLYVRMHAGENTLPAEILAKARSDPPRISVSVRQTMDNDWIQNDPVLDFALTHRIPEHHRRDVTLFKNLAIGLVQSGVCGEELASLVRRIVSNCPGKTASELWSWIMKAQRGEITEYNKIELNKWIDEFGLPIEKYDTRGINSKGLWSKSAL